VGDSVGVLVGPTVGLWVGGSVGVLVGLSVGETVGRPVGMSVGDPVGKPVGLAVGSSVHNKSSEQGTTIRQEHDSKIRSPLSHGSATSFEPQMNGSVMTTSMTAYHEPPSPSESGWHCAAIEVSP